jgi:hypothetical protein
MHTFFSPDKCVSICLPRVHLTRKQFSKKTHYFRLQFPTRFKHVELQIKNIDAFFHKHIL